MNILDQAVYTELLTETFIALVKRIGLGRPECEGDKLHKLVQSVYTDAADKFINKASDLGMTDNEAARATLVHSNDVIDAVTKAVLA